MTAAAHTPEELEAQYNFRARRPDYSTVVEPDWLARSERARQQLSGRLDLAYGPCDRDRIDLFPADVSDSSLLVYFHGGYWQKGDKSMYSFLAEPFVGRGISVAVVNYPLCPAVRVAGIRPQVQRAMAWLYDEAAGLGFARERIHVMGHSAGGQITGMLMGTDWTQLAAHLPRDLIKGGIPISALFDLRPLLFTSINKGLQLDAAEAAAESPMAHPPVSTAAQLVVCGGAETEHLRRQSDDYVRTFAGTERRMERYDEPGCDHFDVVNALADTNSTLFQKVVKLVQG